LYNFHVAFMVRLPLALLLLVWTAVHLGAQEPYPTRPITMIVPFAAGGSSDIVARVVSDGLKRQLDQTIVIDNKPGGNGIIGTRDAVKAKPDGYTLYFGNVGIPVIASAMNSNFSIDPARDLVPISMVAKFAIIVLVRKTLPVDTLAELIAFAKANSGKLNFGSSGVGTLAHLVAELLMQRTDIEMQHVPYKGGGNSLTDLMSGNLDVLFASSSVAAGQVDSGMVKALAVSSTDRLKLLPNVPTIQESGISDFNIIGWFGVFAPRGLPNAIRDRLSVALVDVAREPDLQEKLRQVGFEPVGSGAATFDRFFRAELKRWAAVVAERGLRTHQ
jgi:tripartite-type tricarboxylate transporter receptor subunit TctC